MMRLTLEGEKRRFYIINTVVAQNFQEIILCSPYLHA